MNPDKTLQEMLDKIRPESLPEHVAIIMDGNGRWASLRGKERGIGHTEGISSVHRAVEFASDIGIKYLTLYAFSTENWSRPKTEVDTLMYLIGWAIERELPELIRQNVRLRLAGDISSMPEESRRILNQSVDRTKHCTGMTLFVCLSYSGRWDIAEMVRKIAGLHKDDKLSIDEIDEQTVSRNLSLSPAPDPDLLIRTGGDRRISNFLLWQMAYTELYFTDVLWPDFQAADFARALIDYQNRERRFGKTSQQINNLQQ